MSGVKAGEGAKLYTREMLALSVSLASYPMLAHLAYRGRAKSRSCGSSLEVGLSLDDDGTIAEIGLSVTACAVGQAAAAIFATGAKGRTAKDLERAHAAIECWLKDGGDMPDWCGFEALNTARDYPGRHDAIMLPWTAARMALSNGPKHR